MVAGTPKVPAAPAEMSNITTMNGKREELPFIGKTVSRGFEWDGRIYAYPPERHNGLGHPVPVASCASC